METIGIHCALLLLFIALTAAVEEEKYFETFFDNGFNYDRNAVKLESYKWPNGKIPYRFNDQYNETEKSKVLKAIALIEKETCVDFVEYSGENDTFIEFVKDRGCGAQVGYRPNQDSPMEVTYSDYCLTEQGAIVHELLHVTGLFHEQTRPDRDEYVKIHWDNMKSENRQNFVKGPPEYVTTFDLPYDFKSLMHYPRHAFAKRQGLFTMTALNDTEMELGQTKAPTFLDLEKVRRMYNCSSKKQPNNPSNSAPFPMSLITKRKTMDTNDDE